MTKLENCQIEERLALKECQKFLTEIDVARRISNSKRIFLGAASILREFNFACSKYEEYKTCVGLITKNAGCLNSKLAVKEQLLNFVCQSNVREAMAHENEPCISALAESPKVKECEDAMRKSLENSQGDLCDALDQTLSCTKSELLTCGRNTLSYVTNIVTTIKANMDECNNQKEVSGDSGIDSSFVKTVISRPGVTITEIKTTSEPESSSKSQRKPKKPKIRKTDSKSSGGKNQCPSTIVKQASVLCFPLLSSRTVKQALNPLPGEFLLAKFNNKNLEPFCDEAAQYRQCLENLYSSDHSCYSQLKEDAFYSFIVAFEDKLCEPSKKLEFLINAGCLEETINRPEIRRCLYRSAIAEDRLLCKTKRQLSDCVLDSIITNCRPAEIKYYEGIFENLEIRKHFCTPNIDENDEGNESDDNDDEPEATSSVPAKNTRRSNTEIGDADESKTSDKLVTQDCFRSRQIGLIREDSYIPECKENGEFQPMQCDRVNGSCFCVDEITGELLAGSANGPADPLPLCGLKALFTCKKLPSKLFCEVDGTIAQKTERWYRRGDRCVMYLYDYCPQQSHIPPIPLRSKSDCERFCLPSS